MINENHIEVPIEIYIGHPVENSAQVVNIPRDYMVVSEVPEVPDVPNVSEVPGVPRVPEVSYVPNVSEVSDVPGVSRVPEVSEVYDVPVEVPTIEISQLNNEKFNNFYIISNDKLNKFFIISNDKKYVNIETTCNNVLEETKVKKILVNNNLNTKAETVTHGTSVTSLNNKTEPITTGVKKSKLKAILSRKK